MKIFKTFTILVIAVFLFLAALIFWEESRVVNTGFTPVYENATELEMLFEKAQTQGLSQEESERLDWLVEDKKAKADLQLKEFLERRRNERSK